MSAANIKAGMKGQAAAEVREAADILEHMAGGFIAVDRDWRITYVNTETERLSGARAEQMLGRTLWEILPVMPGTPDHSEFLRAAAENTTIDLESYCGPWKHWLRIRVHPAYSGVTVFLQDITDQKTTEAALRASEERLRAIVETTPECVKVVAPGGALLHMNPSGLAMVGATAPESVVGGSVYDLIAPESRDSFIAFNEAVCRGEKGSLEFDIIGLDGQRRHMETHATPVRQPDGTTVQLAITHDVTERRRRERAALMLGAIVDSSDDAIISKDLNGVVTSWNKSAERLFGYTSEEAVGQSITIIIPEDRLEEEPHILSRLRRGERIDHFETIRRRKDGALLNISLTISPVRDSRGIIIGASKIARDITAAKQAERASLLLSAIVDSSDDAIVSKDLNGIITSWNKGAERVFGYTAEEVVGKPIYVIIPPDRLDEEPRILSRLRRGERVDHFETIRRRKDGVLIDVSLTISPVKDGRGNVIGASKIARDITRQKRAEKEIQLLNARLTADLAAMTRMQQLSTRLVQAENFPVLLDEIIEAGIEISGADMGNIQLAEDGVFTLAAHRGYEAPFIEFFNTVRNGEAACGAALQSGQRVIIEDVLKSPILAGTPALEALVATRARAVQTTPLLSRSGKVLGMFSTHYREPRQPDDRQLRLLDILARQAADLIERKLAESALLASEARFRQLADSMPQIVWTAGPDGSVDYLNERWYEFTGKGRDVFGDVEWERVLHPDDVRQCHEQWYASVSSGEPFQIESRFWDRRNSCWCWFMIRALPVRDSSGAIIKWFGTSTDIDEQKRAQDELRRANQDLEQFAYSASHDLQEPLRTINIYSQLLASRYGGELEGEASEFLDYLRTGAVRMQVLVRDLLEYTQVGRLDTRSEPVNSAEAFDSALANLGGAIRESGAAVTSDALPQVRAHPTHLRQLFQNLIGNAIKYRRPDRKPAVHVSAREQSGSAIFSVRDNGIGIEPEYGEQIFGLFKRLHTGDKYSGTGIGLAICKRIVERYHGRIWVESEPGEGSIFFFSLPT